MLRAHQATIDSIIRRMCAGQEDCTDILAHVTPGGGKSAIPLLVGRLINAGMADKICWVVPRLTLQYQAETNFIDPAFRKMLRHNLSIRCATNDTDPCRGLSGFVTTYQALGINNTHAVDDFKLNRYILIADEFHHMEVDGIWHKAIQPLAELARYRIMMTGTLSRGDKNAIGFMRYKTVAGKNGAQFKRPITDNTDGHRYVKYSRSDALSEHAIIPVRFFLQDGATSWRTRSGEEHHYESFSMQEGLQSSAIYTAINTEFAEEMLEKGVAHWIDYKRRYRSSQLLVVTANIKLAQKALAYLKARNIPADIATSDDSEAARESIKKLNRNHISCLVGVAMFYEGFDRKQISHIISLTHIRSTPWIEQMVARAVRVDPAIPYNDQYAYVFAPNDGLFRKIVTMIESEQIEIVTQRKNNANPAKGQLDLFADIPGNGPAPHPVIPIGSSLVGEYEKTVGGHEAAAMPQTPSEREHSLRDFIEAHVRRYALNTGIKPARINGEIKKVFGGKARDSMTMLELETVKEHLLIHYPLDYYRRPAVRRSVTRLSHR